MRVLVHLALAGAIATFVWGREYGIEKGAELPIYRWWLSDITRVLNSFATSWVDYLFGWVGFTLLFADKADLMAIVYEVLVFPTSAKEAIDTIIPLDAWRFHDWDNKLANWLGHFAFSVLAIWLVTAVLRWRRIKGYRYVLTAALLFPLAGIFVGQQIALA